VFGSNRFSCPWFTGNNHALGFSVNQHISEHGISEGEYMWRIFILSGSLKEVLENKNKIGTFGHIWTYCFCLRALIFWNPNIWYFWVEIQREFLIFEKYTDSIFNSIFYNSKRHEFSINYEIDIVKKTVCFSR
jgi:hypothetical protein